MGKLIVIEGLDSSGKQTQANLLARQFLNENVNLKKIEFPNYDSQSSALVKMYLSGEFGDKPEDVNPYVASTFFTVDRFASYKTAWGEFYQSGGIVLADRYVTSNMIHQAAKIEGAAEKERYLDWLYDFEYNVFSLPKPDAVIFLNLHPDAAELLMRDRANKFTGDSTKDIHEKSREYLLKCYESALYAAKKYGWIILSCISNNKLRSISDINSEIHENVTKFL